MKEINTENLEKVGTIDDFAEGKGTPINVDGIKIAVFKIDGELHGIQNMCPHRRMSLHQAGHPKHGSSDEPELNSRGEVDEENLCIRCPWHRMEFSLESGVNSPTGMKIATYNIYNKDGDVFVEI